MLTAHEQVQRLLNYSLIQGSPESTHGKAMHDGNIESYGDIASRSRREINFHLLNGTDISSIVHAQVSGVVGSKINIQCVTENTKVNDSFEDLVEEHSEKENFEVTGRNHSSSAWRKIEAFLTIQGGVIVRHHYNTAWKIPYKIELVGIDMINSSKNISAENVMNGLKLDSYGKIIGIYLYLDKTKRESKLFSMDDMDYFIDGWASLSQYTAISRLVTILQTIDGTSQYTKSEIKAAINKAKNGVYWHTELYAPIMQALNEEFNDESIERDERLEEARGLLERLSGRGVGISGSTPTPKEDTITQIDAKSDTVFDTLSNQSQKQISSSMGGSQVGVYKDIEKGNYASIKGAIASDEEHYKITFDDLEHSIIRPYLKRLFQVGVQIGRIQLSREKFFMNPRKYLKFDILRTSKKVIDEQKEATSIAKNLESGVTNLNIEYSKKGLDRSTEHIKAIKTEIALKLKEKELYKKAGLPLPEHLVENMENNKTGDIDERD